VKEYKFMPASSSGLAVDYASLADPALVGLVQGGDRGAFREITQRCNQRLFRVARGVLNDDAEAEDVVQAAYVDAYAKLGEFRGEASLLTWLTRIVLNEAYGRLRARHTTVGVEQIDLAQGEGGQVLAFTARTGGEDPAAAAARAQIRRLLESAVDALPEPFRIVFVMREVEGCSVEETAHALELRPETVKTRLHRARRLLRVSMQDSLSSVVGDAFPFLGARCARLTEAVLQRIQPGSAPCSTTP
jgi:RNA polymerase sigma factor (sigma-70 family)